MRAAGASHKLIVSMEFSRHHPPWKLIFTLPPFFIESNDDFSIPFRFIFSFRFTRSGDRLKSTVRAKTVGPNCSRSLVRHGDTRIVVRANERQPTRRARNETANLVFFPPGNTVPRSFSRSNYCAPGSRTFDSSR